MLPDAAGGALHLVHLAVGDVLRVGRLGQRVDVVAQLGAGPGDLGPQHLGIVLAHRFSSSWPFRAFGTLLSVSVVFGRPRIRSSSRLAGQEQDHRDDRPDRGDHQRRPLVPDVLAQSPPGADRDEHQQQQTGHAGAGEQADALAGLGAGLAQLGLGQRHLLLQQRGDVGGDVGEHRADAAAVVGLQRRPGSRVALLGRLGDRVRTVGCGPSVG